MLTSPEGAMTGGIFGGQGPGTEVPFSWQGARGRVLEQPGPHFPWYVSAVWVDVYDL